MNTQLPSNLFFDFKLPENLVAHTPSDKRDGSRLLFCDNGKIKDYLFHDIVDLIPDGSVLVRNVSKVIPARLVFGDQKKHVELFFLKRISERSFEALVRPGKKFKLSSTFNFLEYEFEVSNVLDSGNRIITYIGGIADFEILDFFNKFGSVPLPPYIKTDDPTLYANRYQTVFAKTEGSVAAPTASLHFTDDIIHALENKCKFVDVCLHVGLGTFAPIKGQISDHVMHAEYYEVSPDACNSLNDAVGFNKPIIALGTTALRVLQTVYKSDVKQFDSGSGVTNIFIKPPFSDFACNGLLTNFHLPKSTLLLLINAFIGCENTRKVYHHAIDSGYRFYSFGDASLLLR